LIITQEDAVSIAIWFVSAVIEPRGGARTDLAWHYSCANAARYRSNSLVATTGRNKPSGKVPANVIG
jgi:hypothetical protein